MKARLVGASLLAAILVAIALVSSRTGGDIGATSADAFAAGFVARSANNRPPETTAAGAYSIDPVHTTIAFSARHLVINDVPGRFREFAGTIQYDPDDPAKSSVTFKAKAASLDTGVEQRDNHLRSADFFDVANYPEITFKSTRIEKKAQNDYIANGDFTLRGVTKQLALPFKLYGTVKDPWGKIRLGVEAGTTINRQDYGVKWNQVLDGGGLAVSNEVKIRLLVEAVKQEPAPPQPAK
ncbi:MAG TPA: YceI family protein [Blastocatellia bacterium]|nr:YceI family protein [Blastocatellia bacterium]